LSFILFVDMLGGRRRWQTGGIAEAVKSFNDFTRLVVSVARKEAQNSILGGGIETDSAMLVFEDLVSAVTVAGALYRRAFSAALNANASRLWLRGCIVAGDGDTAVRRETRIHEPLGQLSVYTYTAAALEAISVEKSGYKGMRLIVQKDLISRDVSSDLRLSFGTHSMLTFTTLRYSAYPTGREGEFSDFLWMAAKDDEEWFRLNLQMMSRLRYASRDTEEAAQAAATQVAFHEVAAIRQSVIGRVRRAGSRKG
jgi:hypothetical protein